MAKKTLDINKTILERIKFRYEAVPIDGLSKSEYNYGIIDTLLPYYLNITTIGGGIPKMEPGAVAISEITAKFFNVPQLHISELISIFGYTKTSLGTLLNEVKKHQYDIGLIGYGGTGTNFLHWISQMAVATNTKNIFNRIHIYDDDYFDSVNLPRIPFEPKQPEHMINVMQKVNYAIDYGNITKNFNIHGTNLIEKNMNNKYIYYGAPDLETRNTLYENEIAFIAATHRDNACMLNLRPKIDTELQIETYGKISLTPFFLNHIKMTLKFMEFLAEGQKVEDLRKTSKILLDYDFTEKEKDFIEHGKRINGKTLYPIVANDKNRREMEIPQWFH